MNFKNRHIPPRSLILKLLAVVVGFVCLYLLDAALSTFMDKPKDMAEGQTEVKISMIPVVEEGLPLQPMLPRQIIPQVKKIEPEPRVEPESEQVLPQKLSFEEYCKRNPISTCWNQQKPEDFLYKEDSEPVAVVKNEEFAPEFLTEPADIEKTYEEELPEDVIETNYLAIDEVYNSKIYNMHILPTRKPPYFEIPAIAVVIDDMGISRKRTADIASIKAPLTASFLTYSKNLEAQIVTAKANGQEIMIHVPMEAKSDVDVAPDVLTTQMSEKEIQENLRKMIDKFVDVKGINNHMGSKLTEDRLRIAAVMSVLKEKSLFFLDSKTSPRSCAKDVAAEKRLAYAHRHVFIDNNNDKDYILGQLKKAENIARRNGYAVAIGHPKTQTYEALKEWLPALAEKKIELVPMSEIVEKLNVGLINKK